MRSRDEPRGVPPCSLGAELQAPSPMVFFQEPEAALKAPLGPNQTQNRENLKTLKYGARRLRTLSPRDTVPRPPGGAPSRRPRLSRVSVMQNGWRAC